MKVSNNILIGFLIASFIFLTIGGGWYYVTYADSNTVNEKSVITEPSTTEPGTVELQIGDTTSKKVISEVEPEKTLFGDKKMVKGSRERINNRTISDEEIISMFPTSYETKIAIINNGMVDINIQSVDGTKINTADLKGEPYILEFMRTTCGTCFESMKEIENYTESDPEVKLYSVSTRDTKDILEEFIKLNDMGRNIYIPVDEDGNRIEKVGDLFKLKSVPTFLFIDETNTIQFVYNGQVSSNSLKNISNFVFGLE